MVLRSLSVRTSSTARGLGLSAGAAALVLLAGSGPAASVVQAGPVVLAPQPVVLAPQVEDSVLVASRPPIQVSATASAADPTPTVGPTLAPEPGPNPVENTQSDTTTDAAQAASAKPEPDSPESDSDSEAAQPSPAASAALKAAEDVEAPIEVADIDAELPTDNEPGQGPPSRPAEVVAAAADDAPPAGLVTVTDSELEAAELETSEEPAPAEPKQRAHSDVATALLGEFRPPQAAPFNGITAGVSSREELISEWGEPASTQDTVAGEVLVYEVDGFESIKVLVADGRVDLIRVGLQSHADPGRLASTLRVDAIEPVAIREADSGAPLGIAYPEKGLTLILAGAGGDAPAFVTHMVLQAPDAETFTLRAENEPFHFYAKRLQDLNTALRLNEDYAYARWLRSGIFSATGQPEKAFEDADAAYQSDQENAAFALRRCECLADLGRYDEAVLEGRKIIDRDDAPTLVRAGALHLLGAMASLGEAAIAEKAIRFQTMAIDLADTLATSENANQRRAAKRLLVDAHLAVAVAISQQDYAEKNDVLAQWIGRASGLAEDLIADEQGSLELRLRVAQKALEALSALKPSKDPGPWVKEAEEAATAVIKQSEDPYQASQAHWRLGEAYFHALRISHARRDVDTALTYGSKAIDRLAAGSGASEPRPAAEELVGRLYFYLGAAHAVYKQDHAQAVEWYDRARPRLTAETPATDLVVSRQLGEALVSMGVSYWEREDRDRAVELTSDGAKQMEKAVAAGVILESALAVPYGNLATMYRRLGDLDQSAAYAKLARASRATVADVQPQSKPAANTAKFSRQQPAPNTGAPAAGGDRTAQGGSRAVSADPARTGRGPYRRTTR